MFNRQQFKLQMPQDSTVCQLSMPSINSNLQAVKMQSQEVDSDGQRQIRKKKKRKSNFEDQLPHSFRKKPRQAKKLYKQTQKMLYVDTFIRKLKQLIIKTTDFTHPLCDQSENNINKSNLRTFLINQKFQIVFSMMIIIMVVLNCIFCPLLLVFPQIQDSFITKIFTIFGFVFFTCEFAVNIFSRSSINISNHKQNNSLFVSQSISQYFHSGWLIVDATNIVILFIDIWLPFYEIHYFKLIILLKLFPLVTKINNLEILLIKNCFKEQFWQLLKAIIFNFIFAHFIAIILLQMASSSTNSWLITKNLQNQQWQEQYIWAYYWATNIMFTVGFGDITPVNSKQALVMIFIQSFSCMVLAYNIANMSKIINKISSYSMQKIVDLKIFSQMQQKQPVSQDIRNKITNYIVESAQLKRNFNANQQTELVSKLPKTFYQQLKKQSTSKIFNSIPFFRNLKFSKLQQLAVKMDKKLTHPQQIIVEAGTVPEIFIINNGHISYNLNRVGLKSHNKQIQTFKIEQNQFKIASMYFFIRKPIQFDIKCKNYTILYSISKKQLQSLLNTNPYCYEYYCMYKDKDRFNASDWQTQACDLCNNKVKHNYFECPQLHYIPMKSIVIAKALHNNSSSKFKLQRLPRRRRITKTDVSALKYYSQIQEIFKAILTYENSKKIISKIRKATQKIKTIKFKKSNTYLEHPSCQTKDHKVCFQKSQVKIFSQNSLVDKQKITPDQKYMHKLAKNDEIKEDKYNDQNSCEVQCCHQSSILMSTMIKIQCLKSISKNKSKKISIYDVCKELTDKIKDQITKSPSVHFSGINCEDEGVDLDSAYDYGVYFQSDNPSCIRKKWKKKGIYHKIIQSGAQ